MLKYEELEEVLKETGIEYSLVDFEQIDDIATPFLAYYEIGEEPFSADGIIYFSTVRINIELVDVIDENENMDKLEKALLNREVFFTKDISYSHANSLKSISYEFEVLKCV